MLNALSAVEHGHVRVKRLFPGGGSVIIADDGDRPGQRIKQR
jgi:hypothetical protein